jgi:O-antigen ligase
LIRRLQSPHGLTLTHGPTGLVAGLAAAVLAFLLGALIGQSGKMSWVLIGALVGLALVAMVTELGVKALLLWVAIAPLAHPFVQVPRHHAYVTFDRVWVASMITLAFAQSARIVRTRESRLVAFSLAWLSLAFVVRVVSTSGFNLYGLRLWFDALVLPLVLFFVARSLLTTRAAWTRTAGALTIAGTVLAVIGILEKIFGFQLATLTGGEPQGIIGPANVASGLVRISGPYPYPEMYGMTLLICFGASLYWLQARGRRVAVVAGTAATLQGVAITLTFFRATWIGAILVLIAAFGIRPRRFGRLLGVTAAVVIVLLAIAAPLQGNAQFAQRASNSTNVNARLATYLTGIHIFEHAPLFGAGFGRFASAEQDTTPVVVGGQQPIPYPHSSYFWLLTEQGLFGTLPFVFLTFAVWRLARALRRAASEREEVLLAACLIGVGLAFLVTSLTLTMLAEAPPNMFFALLLGAAAARLDVLRRERVAENQAPA